MDLATSPATHTSAASVVVGVVPDPTVVELPLFDATWSTIGDHVFAPPGANSISDTVQRPEPDRVPPRLVSPPVEMKKESQA